MVLTGLRANLAVAIARKLEIAICLYNYLTPKNPT
jgi:hypothetical protein